MLSCYGTPARRGRSKEHEDNDGTPQHCTKVMNRILLFWVWYDAGFRCFTLFCLSSILIRDLWYCKELELVVYFRCVLFCLCMLCLLRIIWHVISLQWHPGQPPDNADIHDSICCVIELFSLQASPHSNIIYIYASFPDFASSSSSWPTRLKGRFETAKETRRTHRKGSRSNMRCFCDLFSWKKL